MNLQNDGAYEFYSEIGIYDERMVLMFRSSEVLSTPEVLKKSIQVHYVNDSDELLLVNPNLLDIEEIIVTNLLGQQIETIGDVPATELQRYTLSGISIGAYIVQLKTALGKVTRKVLVH